MYQLYNTKCQRTVIFISNIGLKYTSKSFIKLREIQGFTGIDQYFYWFNNDSGWYCNWKIRQNDFFFKKFYE